MSDWREKAKHLIRRHEGCREQVYTDTEGHPTVGVGFNLDSEDACSCLAVVGADYQAILDGTDVLTAGQIESLFDISFRSAEQSARSVCRGFDQLPDAVRIALVDMAYNLGQGGLAKFKKMLAAIEAGDWNAAVVAGYDSRWAKQVPMRAAEDMGIISVA